MSSASRAVMLAALCLGVLLVGIELFITAVALPRIIVDLSGWTDLRRASWIITAYLVAYIAATPLAGRAADRFGLPALMMASLALFGLGSLFSGAAQSLEQLVVARAIQGVGAGAIVPLATAGASHLYTGHARSRALGFVGAATFLGMAVGPVLGALVLENLQLRDALASVGIWGGALVDLLAPSWRWVFYITAPLSALALIYVWAASPGWDVKPSRSSMDAIGATFFTVALTSGLLAITLVGEQADGGGLPLAPVAAVIALLAGALAARRMLRTPEPFLDLRLFANRVFSGAVLVSLLTGYALATAIIGVATFVDRVRFSGPEEQGMLLGPLALAMAAGAFVSGFATRRVDATLVTMAGLAISIVGLLLLSTVRIDTELAVPMLAVSLFGLGFGLTVTPRTTAAVEAAGRAAFGMASGMVTVARMVGMGLGMAILTAFATTRIDTVSVAIEDQAFRDTILPPELVGAPLGDPMVLDALERWASAQAADVLGQLFIVAAIVLLVTAIPAWLMHGRRGRTAGTDATARAGTSSEPGAASSGRDARPPGTDDQPADSDEKRRASALASEDGRPVAAALLARHVVALVGDGRLLVVSDFDGTLSGLVSDPWGADMVPAARRALRRLAVAPGVQVVLLSGRTVLDLAGRARVGGIHYLGDHGAEWATALARLPARCPSCPARAGHALRRPPWPQRLRREVPRVIEEAWLVVEAKGPALTFHFRAAPDIEAARARLVAVVDAPRPRPRPRPLRWPSLTGAAALRCHGQGHRAAAAPRGASASRGRHAGRRPHRRPCLRGPA